MARIILKEFGCGHSIRTGTQITAWIILLVSLIGLFELNSFYYETKAKKISGPESAILSLLIVNFALGVVSSLSGLVGAYRNHRIWVKSFFVYLLCQFAVVIILIWIFATLIYPDIPPNPRKTRYTILNMILFVSVFFGLLAYTALNAYSYHRHLSEEISGSGFEVPIDHHEVLVHEDAFPSNMSSVSGVTTRSYLTTTQVNERHHQRFLNTFTPPTPLPEENHTQNDSKELLIGS